MAGHRSPGLGEFTLGETFFTSSIMRIVEIYESGNVNTPGRWSFAARFGWTNHRISTRHLFLRREVRVTALLIDSATAGVIEEPSLDFWPATVRTHLNQDRYVSLLTRVRPHDLRRHTRCMAEELMLLSIYGLADSAIRFHYLMLRGDVADYLGVTKSAIQDFSKLPGFRYGHLRFWRRAQVEAYARGREIGPFAPAEVKAG
jgi:hypothetical protein